MVQNISHLNVVSRSPWVMASHVEMVNSDGKKLEKGDVFPLKATMSLVLIISAKSSSGFNTGTLMFDLHNLINLESGLHCTMTDKTSKSHVPSPQPVRLAIQCGGQSG